MDSDLFRDTFNVANCWNKKSGKHSIEIVLVLLSRSSMLVMAEGTAGSIMFMPSRFAFSLVSLFSLVSARDLLAKKWQRFSLATSERCQRRTGKKIQGSKIRRLLEI